MFTHVSCRNGTGGSASSRFPLLMMLALASSFLPLNDWPGVSALNPISSRPALASDDTAPIDHSSLNQAFQQLDLQKAGKLLEQSKTGNESNSEWLWEKARYEFEQGSAKGVNGTVRNALYTKALESAKKALSHNPQSGGAHGWYASILGKKLMEEAPEQQIKQAYVIRDHLKQAISLSPQDPNFYLGLGRWHYELSELGWFARKVASTFFATPPEADLAEGARLLQKAVKLDPDNLMAWYYLALIHRKLGDEAAAQAAVKQGLARPVRPHEAAIVPDLKKLNASF